ncbi:hypothetical protein TNCT_128331 [Trichonephila clavata]|uniref:Uncharacterized protein n=1 Tax=Trichonephila clavata TaxID=2740835 RepID=A0A8X6GKB2_TRICU|nr:hypothetical protein TNCT_128331 [Trichonephila clavata]
MTHSPVQRIAAVNPDRQFDHGFTPPHLQSELEIYVNEIVRESSRGPWKGEGGSCGGASWEIPTEFITAALAPELFLINTTDMG